MEETELPESVKVVRVREGCRHLKGSGKDDGKWIVLYGGKSTIRVYPKQRMVIRVGLQMTVPLGYMVAWETAFTIDARGLRVTMARFNGDEDEVVVEVCNDNTYAVDIEDGCELVLIGFMPLDYFDILESDRFQTPEERRASRTSSSYGHRSKRPAGQSRAVAEEYAEEYSQPRF
jgi:hypothetical protein